MRRDVQDVQALLQGLLDFRDLEEERIGAAIHDGVVQRLVGALLRLEAFSHSHRKDPPEVSVHLDVGLQLIREGICTARRLIGSLRPPILSQLGVVPAIENLICEMFRDEAMAVEFDHEIGLDRPPPRCETAIFSIVKEALSNALRNRRSGRVRVKLSRHGDRIGLEVRDWGVGFDLAKVKGACMGLREMCQRARWLQGRFAVHTAPGQGTRIVVDLPLTGIAAIASPPHGHNDGP